MACRGRFKLRGVCSMSWQTAEPTAEPSSEPTAEPTGEDGGACFGAARNLTTKRMRGDRRGRKKTKTKSRRRAGRRGLLLRREGPTDRGPQKLRRTRRKSKGGRRAAGARRREVPGLRVAADPKRPLRFMQEGPRARATPDRDRHGTVRLRPGTRRGARSEVRELHRGRERADVVRARVVGCVVCAPMAYSVVKKSVCD